MNKEKGCNRLVETFSCPFVTRFASSLKSSLLHSLCSAEVNLYESVTFWSFKRKCLRFGERRRTLLVIQTMFWSLQCLQETTKD